MHLDIPTSTSPNLNLTRRTPPSPLVPARKSAVALSIDHGDSSSHSPAKLRHDDGGDASPHSPPMSPGSSSRRLREVHWGQLTSPVRLVLLGWVLPLVLVVGFLSCTDISRRVACLPDDDSRTQEWPLDCTQPPYLVLSPSGDFGEAFSVYFIKRGDRRVHIAYRIEGTADGEDFTWLRNGTLDFEQELSGAVGGFTQPLLGIAGHQQYRIRIEADSGARVPAATSEEVAWATKTATRARIAEGVAEAQAARPKGAISFVVEYVTRRFSRHEAMLRLALTAVAAGILAQLVRALRLADPQTQRCAEQPWVVLLLLLMMIGVNDPIFAVRLLAGGVGRSALASVALAFFCAFACTLLFFLLLVVSSLTVSATHRFRAPHGHAASSISRWKGKAALATVMWLVMVCSGLSWGFGRQSLAALLVLILLWLGWFLHLLGKALYRFCLRRDMYSGPQQLFITCTLAYLCLMLAWLYYIGGAASRGDGTTARLGVVRSRKLISFPFLAMTNQYVCLLSYVYWPSRICLVADPTKAMPYATAAMLKPLEP